MDLGLVIGRIRAQLPGLKGSGGSADLEAAMAGVLAVPAAFVIPLGESAERSATTLVTRQRITHNVGVVLAVSNRRDAAGAAALSELAPLRLALRAALVGWAPDAAEGEPLQFERGRLLRLAGDGRLWWMDEFFFLSTYRSQ